MAKTKRTVRAPRYPERKWGPFHGGVGLACWLNEVQTADGPRFFRSVTLARRRYRDPKTGEWKDAASLRPTDLPALILALEAAHAHCQNTPLPGQAAEGEDLEEVPPPEPETGSPNQPPF